MNQHNYMVYPLLDKKDKYKFRQHMHMNDTDKVNLMIHLLSEKLGIATGELLSQKRTRELVWTRFVIMNYMRRVLRMSLTAIGKYLDRDHSTVIYGIEQYDNLRYSDKEFKAFAERLEFYNTKKIA